MGKKIKVITMYSFKGGAGRTVCTANLAKFIAKSLGATPDHPFLLMDMDLDSAGLTSLLDREFDISDSLYSCSNLLQKKFDIGNRSHERAIFEEDGGALRDVSNRFAAEFGTVRFLGTPIVGPEELTHITRDSIKQMKYFLELCEDRNFAGIMIDSASGRQESALLCHRVSDLVTYCLRITEQFVFGTPRYLRHFIQVCKTEQRRAPAIVLLPVAVPKVEERWERVYQAKINIMQGWERTYGKDTEVRLMTHGIPEVQAFKWTESVLQDEGDPTEDELQALQDYESVANSIVEMLNVKSEGMR